MSEEDIRNVIYLDELQENRGEEEQEEKKEERKSIFLSESELKSKLDSYRGRIPSVILKDLYDVLKGRKITDEQLKKILNNVEKKLRDRGEVDITELYAKMDRLEKALQKLLRMQVRQAITASSEHPSEDVEELKRDAESEGEVDRGSETVDVEKTDVGMGFIPQAAQLGERLKKELPRTFLDKIPKNTSSMMFLLRWIEHLIERVGYSGIEDVLDYYVDIGWISEDVMFDILKHAKGIRLYHENADWRPAGYMSVHDHLMSLLFIEALKTGRMNKEILHEVERQVYRIKKGVSEINGI